MLLLAKRVYTILRIDDDMIREFGMKEDYVKIRKIVEELRNVQRGVVTIQNILPSSPRDEKLVRIIHDPSYGRQPERVVRVSDPESTWNEPRRRWIRKRVAAGVSASIGGKPGLLVDVSYGGFRVECPNSVDARRADALALDVP